MLQALHASAVSSGGALGGMHVAWVQTCWVGTGTSHREMSRGELGKRHQEGSWHEDYFALWGEGVSSRTDLQSSALPPSVTPTNASAESSLASRAGGRYPMSASQAVEEGLLV